MYTFKVENEKNEIYDITGSGYHRVLFIGGLSPAAAEISTSDAVGYDGGIYTYGRCGQRNITIQLAMVGNIEESRQMLYQYFVPKKTVRLYFKNANRDVYIDGRVETVDIDPFSQMQTADISIICPQPYFVKNEETTHSLTMGSDNKHSVTLAGGETESGVIFDIHISDAASTEYITIENVTTGDKIVIEYRFVMDIYDIHVNTIAGEKQAYSVDRFGTKKNLLPYLKITGGWVDLAPGNNTIKVYSSNLSSVGIGQTTMTAERLYIGV